MLRTVLLSVTALFAVSCAQFKAPDVVKSDGMLQVTQEAQAGGDVFDQKIQTLRALAEKGDANARFSLGQAYERGIDVPKDPAEGMRWYRLAAEQGDPFTLFYLGNKLWEGVDVPKDEKDALWHWTLAAEQGFAPAQASLGMVLSTGSSEIVVDKVKAYVWLSLASDQGDKEVKQRLGRLVKWMQPKQTAEARKLLKQWKPARMISVVSTVARWR
jgi:TPR repeat protein